jgi:hypothetical protein
MDRYIDNSETQIYGPKLRDNLTRAFPDAAPPVKAFIAHLVKLQAAADQRMADGMAKARGASSDLSAAASAKSPLAEAGRKLLTGFYKHLASKKDLEEWSGDTKVFFPKDIGGIGNSAPEIAAALATAQKGFEKDKTVPGGEALRKRLATAEQKLRAEIEKSGGAIKAARAGLSEQSVEKKDWLVSYRGLSLIAEGLLTLEKRGGSVRSLVPHLSVSSGKATGKAKAKSVKTAKAPKANGAKTEGAAP